MISQALVCDEKQQFSLAEVVLPDPKPDQIVVRTLWSGVSIGTEFALVRNKISWGPYPICTGYQAVGIVMTKGDDVCRFNVGDKVFYRCNRDITLSNGQKVSPTLGAHCQHAVLSEDDPDGIGVLPPGVEEDIASLFVMPAVGMVGVNMAKPENGELVVVHGVGLIGLGVVATCAQRGCRIVAVDVNTSKLKIAEKLGADFLIDAGNQIVSDELKRIDPKMADVVFECTGNPELLDTTISLCRNSGRFVWQGNYGTAPVCMDFQSPHLKQLTMYFPCSDGGLNCRLAALRNMALGALKLEEAITHRVDADYAPILFDRINKNQAPEVIGAVIRWVK